MKRMILLLLIAAFISLPLCAQEAAPKVYDTERNQLEQIDQAIAKAQSEGKYVICQLGGNWCPWCLRFAKFITDDPEIHQLISQNFVYEHVNFTSKQDECSMQASRRLSNASRFGFPVFVVLDTDGKVIHIQDSSFLEEGKGYNRDKVLRFLKSWTPAAVAPNGTL